jgi:hypothetical protein
VKSKGSLIFLPLSLPVPWQDLFEPLGKVFGDSFENVGELCLRIDAALLCGADQG